MAKAIGVPSLHGIGHSFGKFGWGIVGGLIFILAYRLFGALGLLAAPIIAGSVMKGENGDDLAFMSGFLILALGAFGAGVASGNTQDVSSEQAV